MSNTISITSSDGRSLCETCLEFIDENSIKCPHCGHTIEARASRRPAALPLGTILLGKYAVGKVLGMGGFGITYLAYDLVMNRKVAIKEYYPTALASRKHNAEDVVSMSGEKEQEFQLGAKKFYEEAERIARFNGNPNIISVYEFFYQNNTAYYVMEYLDGDDLVHYLNKAGEGLSAGSLVYLLGKITDALMIVHSSNLLHRDIAPDNIFICKNGNIKLIDFGAARQYMSQESQSMSVIVKMGFAPIEQYQKKGHQGPWTDIYALGATAYYALTGKKPDDPFSRMSNPAIDFSGIDPRIAKILNKMLAVQPNQRYQTIFELKAALNSLNVYAVPLVGDASNPSMPNSGSHTPSAAPNVAQNDESMVTMPLASDFVTEPMAFDTVPEKKKKFRVTENRPARNKTVLTALPHAKKMDIVSFVTAFGMALLMASVFLDIRRLCWEFCCYVMPWNALSEPLAYWGILVGSTVIGLVLVSVVSCVIGHFLPKGEGDGGPSCVRIDGETGILIKNRKIRRKTLYLLYGLLVIVLLIAELLLTNVAIVNYHRIALFGFKCFSFVLLAAISLFSIFVGRLLPRGEAMKNAMKRQENKRMLTLILIVVIGILVCSFASILIGTIRTESEDEPYYDDSYAPVITTASSTATTASPIATTASSTATTASSTATTASPIVTNRYSKGLSYVKSGSSYRVTGIGSCTDKAVVIPSEYNGLPVTEIGSMAFYGCSSLTSITIPDSVTEIGSMAFDGCSSLTSITIPNSVTEIGSSAFAGCSSLTSITIPDSVTTIGEWAFYGCSSLATVTLHDGITSIGEYAFYGCENLKQITLPKKITEISDDMFSRSGLTSITIPNGVKRVGEDAFFGCDHLTQITIPSSVTSIDDMAFFICDNLKYIYFGGTQAQWNAFGLTGSSINYATVIYNYKG